MSTPITADFWQIMRSYFNYLDFDGVNDSVNCGNDSSMWSAGLTKFAFSFWIFPTAGWDTNFRVVVSHGLGTNQSFQCQIDDDVTGQIAFLVFNNVGTVFAARSNDLVLNAWNHIVCTYDNSLGSANVKIYVNGVVGSTTANLTQTITLSDNLLWGGSTTDFKGRMLDFRWWGGTVAQTLSATEVNNIFTNNLAQYDSPDPYAWWRIDEGAGNPLDVMANKTATLSGTVWAFQTGLGGDISPRTLDIIDVNDENNLWTNATGQQCLDGSTAYRIFYIRYLGDKDGVNGNSNGKTVKKLSLALAQATKKTGYTTFQWAFVPNARSSFYQDRDSRVFNGTSNFDSKADEAALDLTSTFSVCAWVRTSKDYQATGLDGAIVRKGDVGASLNYGIWFEDAGNIIRGGFEQTGTGTDQFVDSPRSYNDGMWHFVVLTYSQPSGRLRLYVDNIKVASLGTALVPATNSNPLTIARASASSTHFFQGEIDSVRIYNVELSELQIYDLYLRNIEPVEGNIVYQRHYGRNNHQVDKVAPIMKNGDLGPFQAVTEWFDERSDIPSGDDPGNLGEFKFGQYLPILGKWTNEAGTPDIQNDFVQFNLHYTIMAGSTGGGSSGGGSDPGGTPSGGPDPTTPANNDPVTLAFNSDWDSNSMTQKNIDLIKSHSPAVNLIFCGGDLAYGDPNDWFDIFEKNNLFSKLKITIGNHDDGDTSEYFNASFNNGNRYYKNLKKSYYLVVIENIALIAINTEIDFDEGSPQHEAIVQFFKDIKAMKNIDWIITFQHRPPFGASSDHPINEGNFMQTYMEMFDQNGVDFICCAHNHVYQRSFPVKYNSSSPSSPKVTDSGAGPYDANDGSILVHNGTGGHDSGGNLYGLGSQPGYIKIMNNKDNGMSFFDFSNNNKTCTYKWQITEGKIKDSFVVNK